MIAANGIIIDNNKMLKTRSFPGLRYISKPYPAKDAIKSVKKTVMIAMMLELISAGTISTVSNNVFRFSNRYVPGNNRPFVTSTDLFVILTIIHKKGNNEMSDATLKNK